MKPKKLHPYAIKTMLEIGVDISKEKPKSLNEFIHTRFDIIITTTKLAQDKVNSLLTSTTKIHREFDNPRTIRNVVEKENAFRELREEMTEWLNEFIVRHRLV